MIGCGVYRLEHEPSGYVYVGSSRNLANREAHWLRLIAFFSGRDRWRGRWKPSVGVCVADALRQVEPEGWTFVVVERFAPGVDSDVLSEAEMVEIARVRFIAGDLCLNHRSVTHRRGTDRRWGFPVARPRL